MEKEDSNIRWWIKKWAWIISGENPYLLKESSRKSQLWHYFIGVLMSFVITVMVVSLFIFFHSLIESSWISLTMSVLVSISIFNIFRLLIISFSVPTIPVRFEKGLPIFFSRLLRYLIVILIGLFIAQPIGVYLFNKDLEVVVAEHKKEQLIKLNGELNKMHESDLETINEIIAYSNNEDQLFYNERIKEKEFLHEKQLQVVSQLINESNYFIYRVKHLQKIHPLNFVLLELFIVSLFYLPVFFKRRTQLYGDLQTLKKEHDIRLVSSEHDRFKSQYYKELKKFTDNEIITHSEYEDPPFNTIKKSKEFRSQKEFIRALISDKETRLGLGLSKHIVLSDFNAKFNSKMISEKQEFQLHNLYDIELLNPTESNEDLFISLSSIRSEFNDFFKLVVTQQKNKEAIINKLIVSDTYLLELEDVKLIDFEINGIVKDTDEMYGSVSGKLCAEVVYKEVNDRLRFKYVKYEKAVESGKSMFTKFNAFFAKFVKVLYALPISICILGVLLFLYHYLGLVTFVSFFALIGLITVQIKFGKKLKRKWLKALILAGLLISLVLVVAEGLAFVYELILHHI